MLVEGESVDSLSMEAVASRAGVGKATLYRRWANKHALVSCALESLYEPVEPVETGSVRQSLIAAVEELYRWSVETTSGRLLPHLLSAARRSPELYRQYLQAVVEPRREAIREILWQGIRERQLDPALDVEMALTILFGSMLSCSAAAGLDADAVHTMLGGEAPERAVDLVLFGALPAA
jgi:AcrR family transcriptional regulator